MKRALTKYCKRRWKKLRRLLHDASDDPDQEVLHRIRVEIKKTKALLRLLHFQDKDFDDHRVFKAFRKIYRAAGAVREPFVFHSLALKYSSMSADPTELNTDLLMSFKRKLPEYTRRIRKNDDRISKAIKTLRSRTYKRYLKQKTLELNAQLYPTLNKSLLHKIRKLVKEILYLSRIRSPQETAFTFYEKIAGQIGDWHDKMTFIRLLEKSKAPDRDMIRKLEVECKTDVKSLRSEIQKHFETDEI